MKNEVHVRCSGDSSSKHPTVYLIIKKEFVVCPYCGKKITKNN